MEVKLVEFIREDDVIYYVGNYAIVIPRDHPLPRYQFENRLYDRFLGALCSFLPKEGVVVDIGANVGDSCLVIAQNTDNEVIAIEGERTFFSYLDLNVRRSGLADRVKIVNSIVGTKTGTLVSSDGTARLVIGEEAEQETVSLDHALSGVRGRINLIKSDVDGFDFDVLISGRVSIGRDLPVLYWEGGTDNARSYRELYKVISELGYSRIWVFDNFGVPLLSECGLDVLDDLDAYIEYYCRHSQGKTIYYFDILAATADKLGVCRSAYRFYSQTHLISKRGELGSPDSTER